MCGTCPYVIASYSPRPLTKGLLISVTTPPGKMKTFQWRCVAGALFSHEVIHITYDSESQIHVSRRGVFLSIKLHFFPLHFKINMSLDGGSDHVTFIGQARTGMGYRNEFQTENYGQLTNQALLPMGCALSHMWNA